MNAAQIATLRTEIADVRAAQWTILKQQADSLAKQSPPATRANDTSDQIWQRDTGNALPTLAMAWLVTGNPTYRQAVERWSLASCGYPTWGFGTFLNNDLPAGHQLFGLALVYDWMFDDLTPSTRTTIHDTMLSRGRAMYSAADDRTGTYWRGSYLQNHLWVNMAGLAAAAWAMPEEGETASWLDRTRTKFRATENALGSDGASHEGVGYWSYGTEYMLKYWALSAQLTGEDLTSSWWQNTALYRLYLGLPRASWAKNSTAVDIADSLREDYYGPDYQLFNLAHRFQDAHAQWLALELERSGRALQIAPFLNLLWFNPAQAAQSPDDLPTLRNFDDMGIVSARSDWSGNESLLVFKSGAPAGQKEVQLAFPSDPGFGHVHPDANHFVIFGNGRWLMQDDGYAWKETGQHNTLLVDGVGQMGEHAQWFTRRTPLPLQGEPSVLRADPGADFDVIAGDAVGAYATATGVRKFTRTVIFWKPSVVLVLDDMATDTTRNLELRFHPVRDAGLRIDVLTPDGVTRTDLTIDGLDRDNKPLPLWTTRLTKRADSWRNVTALSWAQGDTPAPAITMSGDTTGTSTFQLGDRQITFDWTTGAVGK